MNGLIQLTLKGVLQRFLYSTGRYLIAAGIVYLIFYIWKRSDWIHLRIQRHFPESTKIWNEIKWSFISKLIFVSVISLTGYIGSKGYSKLYFSVAERGWLYFTLSTLFIIFVHDAYFYWIHRFMHWRPAYKRIHYVHHQSTNPTPWAAYSFHPIEAVLEVLIMPILVFTIPLHVYSMLIMSTYQLLMNVLGHSGYELMPRGFTRHPLLKWYGTSTFHNMHHSKFNCNYGLYFTIWDHLFGTTHKEYDATFEALKDQKTGSEWSGATVVQSGD